MMLTEHKQDVRIQMSFLVNPGTMSPYLETGTPRWQKWFCFVLILLQQDVQICNTEQIQAINPYNHDFTQ